MRVVGKEELTDRMAAVSRPLLVMCRQPGVDARFVGGLAGAPNGFGQDFHPSRVRGLGDAAAGVQVGLRADVVGQRLPWFRGEVVDLEAGFGEEGGQVLAG